MPEESTETVETGSQPEQQLSPELQQKIAVDQALKEILADPKMQADFRTAGFYNLDGISVATGKSNRGWDGGWQEGAVLYTDGRMVLGAGVNFVDAGIFQLLPVEIVRQELIKTKQEDFDRMISDPQYRRWRVNEHAWANPNSSARQFFDNPANRPSMENFPPVPPQLVDSEGNAFVDSRDGSILFDHPKYNELLGQKTAADIKNTVIDHLDRYKQFDWWEETYHKANPAVGQPTQDNP